MISRSFYGTLSAHHLLTSLGKLQVPALDLAAKYSELSEALRNEVVERIDDEYGLGLSTVVCR